MTADDDFLGVLRDLTGRPDAEFRDGQRRAIELLVTERTRVLVVQRTGWGKSAVYFISTHLLRRRGSGPTLLISPLLVLMRNQIDAAKRLGLGCMTINSSETPRSPNSRPRSRMMSSTCCSSRPNVSPTQSSPRRS